MKLPQIFVPLVLFCLIIFSCRDTQSKEENSPKQENSIPSAEEHQRPRLLTPKKVYPQPKERSRDSILKKRKKSKDLDTLKPKVAMLKM
jgi:hypothetical protein